MSFRQIYRKPLGVISKSNSRNTTPSRRFNNLNPVPPSQPRPTIEKENKESIFMINLEDILIIEDSFSYMLDNFHNTSELLKTCEKLWDLTADNTLNHIFSLYKDDKKRKIIKKSIVLQSLSIALALYFSSAPRASTDISSLLRSIIYYNHQGFLVISKYISLRLPDDKDNLWIIKLNKLVEAKSNKKKSSDQEKLLAHYNKAISIFLKRICRNFVFKADDSVIHALKTMVIKVLRDQEADPAEARKSIEKVFGYPRDSQVLQVYSVKPPFLPELLEDRYTLVLDLDETMVHYIENDGHGEYLTRPYLENFLNEMKNFFEIVVFTAAVQDYADWILDDLDSSRVVKHRLYRQHTIPAGCLFLKDLSNLGRKLDKMIIIDNVAENFQLQPENGILIKSWYDDSEDTALKELIPILIQIVENNIDVRLALQIFREQMLEQLSKGINTPSLSLAKI